MFYFLHLAIIIYDSYNNMNSKDDAYLQTEKRTSYKILTLFNNIFCFLCTIAFFKLGKDLIE